MLKIALCDDEAIELQNLMELIELWMNVTNSEEFALKAYTNHSLHLSGQTG